MLNPMARFKSAAFHPHCQAARCMSSTLDGPNGSPVKRAASSDSSRRSKAAVRRTVSSQEFCARHSCLQFPESRNLRGHHHCHRCCLLVGNSIVDDFGFWALVRRCAFGATRAMSTVTLQN